MGSGTGTLGLGVVLKRRLCAMKGVLLLLLLLVCLPLFLLLSVKSGDSMLCMIRSMMRFFPSRSRCGLHVFHPEIIGLPF